MIQNSNIGATRLSLMINWVKTYASSVQISSKILTTVPSIYKEVHDQVSKQHHVGGRVTVL